MGIKDLNPFLRETTPDCIKEVSIGDFNGKKVAIDTSIYFYKFLYKNDRYLEGFFQQIFRLRVNGLTPIYIFDGAPPPEKNNILIQRKEKKLETKNAITELQTKYDSIEDPNEKKKIFFELIKMKKKLIFVTREHNDKLKEMLDTINVQYIQASGEADLVCGQMYKHGYADIVMSDDMDLLTSGSRKVFRNFFITSNKVLYYDLDAILNTLELTSEQWIDFCILCGCDYCDRIPSLGPKNAIKLIKQYENVPNILENTKDKYKIPDNYIDNYNKSLEIFKNTDIIEFTYKPITHPGFNGIEKIISMLKENTNLTEKQIMNRLNVIFGN